MTCRGYDPKAVKVPKSVKRIAATYIKNEDRRGLIRSYVRMLEEQSRGTGRKEK